MTDQPDTEQTLDDYDRGFADGRAASVAEFDFDNWVGLGESKGWTQRYIDALGSPVDG